MRLRRFHGTWSRSCCLVVCPVRLISATGAQNLTMQQYDHLAMRLPRKAPAGIHLKAESSDGLLWVLSGSRLLTFDGLKLVPYEPPAGQPSPRRSFGDDPCSARRKCVGGVRQW